MGSVVSQGFGVATGLQDKFSWKAVAMAGIAGGVGGGLGAAFPGGGLGTLATVGRGAALGAAGSALSQGIGVAVGLQKKFDFAGVAAAGLAGGASAGIGKVLGAASFANLSMRNIGANVAASTAGAIANATVRTLVNGTDFGDNLIAALPDVIGSTIGNMVAGALAGGSKTSAFGEVGERSKPSFSGATLPAPEAHLAELLAQLPNVPRLAGDWTPADVGIYGGTSSSLGAASGQAYDVGDIVITGSRRRSSVPLNVSPTFEKSISTERYRTEIRLFPDDAQARFRRFARARPGLTGGQALNFVTGLAEEFGIDAKLGGFAEWNAWSKSHRQGTADYTLRYEAFVENSAYSQLAASFLTSPTGTATLHYLNDGSFGLVSLLDSQGALDLTARHNPRAAQVGQNIGIVAAVLQGGIGLSSVVGRRTIGAGGQELSEASLAGSIRTINPRFPARGFNQNCVECVIATEQRFAGTLGVMARPTSGPLPITRISDQFGGSFQGVSGPMEIGSILNRAGNGSRGIVYGADSARGFGHVWNARMDNGVVRFLDSQPGGRAGLGVNNFDDFTDFKFLLTSSGKSR